ncbi:MAG: hypothetical protein WEA24_11755 [Gemmatimonadota bacterium]
MSADSAVSAEVICYAAVERMFSLSTRHGVYSIITTPGPLDGFHEGLDELVRLQNEHFAARRRYASEGAELACFQVPQHTTIDLTGAAAGWTATPHHHPNSVLARTLLTFLAMCVDRLSRLRYLRRGTNKPYSAIELCRLLWINLARDVAYDTS